MESIYSYRDYRVYLRDYYEQCTANNARFSLRSFALKIGLNVSNLTRILKGERNIAEATAERLVVYLKLRDREAEYFRLLVQYNQAHNPADKQALYEQIRLFRKTRLRNLGAEYDEYFANWYNIALRELLNILPRKLKSAEIAKLLLPSPKPNDIRKSFNLLLQLGLVKEHDDGTLELSEKFVTTPDEWTGTTIHSFQIAMAELGKQALDRFPKNDRNISTFTLSLSPEGFKKTVQALARVQQEIAEIAGTDAGPDRIYELNLQLFPLSKPCKEL
jgi:uncharacterized protein (TIGR02147 family)